MDLLEGYSSSESASNKEEEVKETKYLSSKGKVNAAPYIPVTTALAISSPTNNQPLESTNNQILLNNPKKSILMQPIAGPAMPNPHTKKMGFSGSMESNVAFDATAFAEQRVAFQKFGKAVGPNEYGGVVDNSTMAHHWGQQKTKEDSLKTKKRKLPEDDVLVEGSDDELKYGIWGPTSAEEHLLQQETITDVQKYGVTNLAPEQIAEREHIAKRNAKKSQAAEAREKYETETSMFDRLLQRKMAHLLPKNMNREVVPIEPSSKFHGSQEIDYKGRSWMAPPAGTPTEIPDDIINFVPKKCVHRFTGHNEGVHRIRLFPRTAHLLLSAGLDHKIKLWSISDKRVMRTYLGHSAAVRDVQFDNSGSRFVSAAFDRLIRLWDTESGNVLNTFIVRSAIPYVLKFYPKDDNVFVAGCSDNKIVAYDSTSGEIVQEYNHHLGPVNTITFVEDSTKMMTSSDDKKILIWEWDIGVPIKYISDPTMHSIPCVSMHPSQLYVLGQSLDNQIVVYQAKDRFSLQRKKRFAGHRIAGYACEPSVSSDGRFVASGDGEGNLYFWEWRTHKILQRYRAHDRGPAISCVWHPTLPSTVFTCGWDGVIKMWQ